MRTTILLNDDFGRSLQDAAHSKGVSLSAFLADAGRAYLSMLKPSESEPFKLLTRGGAGVRSDINLDQAGELLAAADEATYRSEK